MPLDPRSPVEIAEADPFWPVRFAELRLALEAALAGLAITVEHVGSTAVPELDAKPILDIAILCDDAKTMSAVRPRLESIGYQSEGERGIAGRESFRRTSTETPGNASGAWMDHHLYLALLSSEYADVQLRFRDYLRRHPEAAERYATLKHSLARAYGYNREEYTERKSAFVRALLAAEAAERNADGVGSVEGPGERPRPKSEVDYDVFTSIDLRIGTVIAARPLRNARQPAIVMEIDAGPLGLLNTSAQLTELYSPEQLLGRQVVAVVNFPPKQIGSIMSRCLVLGAMPWDGVVLLAPDKAVANGTRVL